MALSFLATQLGAILQVIECFFFFIVFLFSLWLCFRLKWTSGKKVSA